MKKRLLSMILSVVMTAALVAGCAGTADIPAADDAATEDIISDAADEEESVLVYGSGDYDSINPIMNEHCEIKHLLFDSLVTRDGEGNLVESLATDWSYDAETMTYSFKLAEGVKWHDGEALQQRM